MNLAYPARFTQNNDSVIVTFRDLPEAQAVANSMAEAKRKARELLVSALNTCLEEGRAIPAPSAPRGDEVLIYPFIRM
jgi:predicted RNase H-like HicB family nuclease